jgi:serine/threonine-protein kinase OSR1/STK39
MTEYSAQITDYIIHEQIGTGAYSNVFRAVEKKLGAEVALKIMDMEDQNSDYEQIYNEVHMLATIHHPHIVKCYVSFCDEGKCYLVMPFFTHGSCGTIIKKNFIHGLKDEVLLATILKSILEAIVYLHKHEHIHRDIKAGNILIDKDGHSYLGDLGIATSILEDGRRKKRHTFLGSPCWIAPEIIECSLDEKEQYDEKVDIWSFGITAMELAYGQPPYIAYPIVKILITILNQDPPTCDIYNDNTHKFSGNFYKMLGKCLKKNPHERISAEDLLKCSFFNQAKDYKYVKANLCDKITKLN